MSIILVCFYPLDIPPMTNFGVYLRWQNENVTDI